MKTNYQALLSKQDPAPFFERWRGGQAAFWNYTVSHRVLELRVTLRGKPGHLSIYCGDVQHLHGPTKWSNCDFELARRGVDEVVLLDQPAGVEVCAGIVGVEEMPEPAT